MLPCCTLIQAFIHNFSFEVNFYKISKFFFLIFNSPCLVREDELKKLRSHTRNSLNKNYFNLKGFSELMRKFFLEDAQFDLESVKLAWNNVYFDLKTVYIQW